MPHPKAAAAAAVSLLWLVTAVGAAPTTAPVITPDARRVLDRFAAHVATLARFEIAVVSKADIQLPGQPPQPPDEEPPGTVTFERPARVSIVAGGQPFLTSDGRTLTVVDRDGDADPTRYWQSPAPPTPDRIVRVIAGDEAQGYVVAALMAADPVASLTEGAERVELAGRADLDGVAHERLRVVRATRDTEVWIPVEGPPLPRREAVDMSRAYAGMAKRQQGAKPPRAILTTDYTDWRTPDRPFDDARFTFAPPPGAIAVPTKEALFHTAPPEAPWKSTLNQPAPAFSLPDLDGKPVALADLKGKVVILDFWATWCGPCVRGLPVVADVARQHADAGVILLAVNLREDADKIRDFLQRQNLDLRVLRDADGKTGTDYKIGGIPHTVVIGRDGRVHSVKVGFGDSTRDELSAALKAALATTPAP